MSQSNETTLGGFLASQLSQLGIQHYFGLPGDYNLTLLDELAKHPDLSPVYTCNELNAGYAAEGYARIKGIGATVVTFTVGGLSLINAIAGAYAENLPVVCIVGGPNSNDFATNHIIHHTIGKKFDFMQELRCFREVTCDQVVVQNLDDAVELIDRALASAISHSKPVYINICCNLSGLTHPSFSPSPVKYTISPKLSNKESLKAATEVAAEWLNSKHKPVFVAGPLLKTCKAQREFLTAVEAVGCPFAVLPAAKGLVPEDHPQFIGTYWGAVSSPLVNELVESADAYVFVGPVFNDYVTCGYSLHLSESKMLQVNEYRLSVGGSKVFGCVRMDDFLTSLAQHAQHNSTALDNYRRMVMPETSLELSLEGSPLQVKHLFSRLQSVLTPHTILMADTGDSLFNCQKLKLPPGCVFEWSQQYGSIGWSVGAVLGAASAAQEPTITHERSYHNASGDVEYVDYEKIPRVVACIGDGSFQVTAQDVSTMLRYALNPVILLINNGGYTIEAQIHDGSYNEIKNWDYVGFVNSIDNGQGRAFASKVTTESELVEALKVSFQGQGRDKLCFLEVVLNKDDCSRELLEWGALVSLSNSRPPTKV